MNEKKRCPVCFCSKCNGTCVEEETQMEERQRDKVNEHLGVWK